jgi:translation initiation factor 2 beta subunit (eIF-2beta)/eIF-5
MSCCSCLTASAILKPEQIKEVQFKNMIAIKKINECKYIIQNLKMLDGRLMVGECEPCVQIPTTVSLLPLQ